MSENSKSNIALLVCSLTVIFVLGDKVVGAESTTLEHRVSMLELNQKNMAEKIDKIDKRNEQLLLVAKTSDGRLNGIEKSLAGVDRFLSLWANAKKK